MRKVVIIENTVMSEAIRRKLNDPKYKGVEVVSNFEKLDTLIQDSLFEDKLPSIEEYIQEINNSTKQLKFNAPAQNCKKNFKRKKFFNI